MNVPYCQYKYELDKGDGEIQTMFHADGRIVTQSQNIEETEEDMEDEVDGKNLIYDSVFVDQVPTLPVKEEKSSYSIAPGENKTPISRLTQNLDQFIRFRSDLGLSDLKIISQT